MKTKTVVVAAALAVLAASSVNAAPVNNNKFYLKANAGYAFTHHSYIGKINNLQSSYKKAGRGFIGGAAIGANLSPVVRADLEFLMDDGLRTKNKSNSTVNTKVKATSTLGLVNAYFDFKNSSKFTPFIMGGVGYGSTKHKATATVAGVTYSLTSKAKKSVAYQAGLGFGVEAGKATFELGYRFLVPSSKKVTLASTSANTSVQSKSSSGRANVIMAGLRVGF